MGLPDLPHMADFPNFPFSRCKWLSASGCCAVTVDGGFTLTVRHSLVCCSPFTDGPAIHEYVLSAIFAVDMALKFRLAFREHEQLVGCPKRILQRYLRWGSRTACWALGLQREP